MRFKTTSDSVIFEFNYKNFVFSIADYVDDEFNPKGKVSILIERHGVSLSSKTVERIVAFIGDRIVGEVWTDNNLIEIDAANIDQAMLHLMEAVDIVVGP